MKKYTLILIASIISSMSFAQVLTDNVTGGQTMSGEVPVLNSAPIVSGEASNGDININLPFDPAEVEDTLPLNAASDYEFPPYSLNSATKVKTGPTSIILMMIAVALGAGIYTYRIRTSKDQ